MAGYRSLLFKELKLSGRHYGFMVLMIVVLTAVCVLGLLVNLEEPPEAVRSIAYFLINALAIIAGCAFSWETEADKLDQKSGFSRYALALPIRARDRAAASYSVRILAVLVGFVLTTAGKILMEKTADTKLDSSYCFIYFLMVCIGFLISVCLKAADLLLKGAGKRRWIAAAVVILGGVFYIGFHHAADLRNALLDDSGMGLVFLLNRVATNGAKEYGAIIFPALIVLSVCGMILSAKIYGRREA